MPTVQLRRIGKVEYVRVEPSPTIVRTKPAPVPQRITTSGFVLSTQAAKE